MNYSREKSKYSVKISESLLITPRKQVIILVMKTVMVTIMLNYIFYREWLAIIFVLPIGIVYFCKEKKQLILQDKEKVREQFKELLIVTAAGQRAGYSAENAFLNSYQDMEYLFGRDSTICRILLLLQNGRQNNISFSEVWEKIGENVDISEIREFAKVYEIAVNSSGNEAGIMEKTAAVIIQKMDTKKELAVLIAERRFEQKIMNLMPLCIMLYVSICAPSYFNSLYHSMNGTIIMSICLAFYLTAYAISENIIHKIT